MAKHYVKVLVGWEDIVELGPLVIKSLDGETTETLQKPKQHLVTYEQNRVLTFSNKTDMKNFLRHHGAKAAYIGTKAEGEK